MNGRRTNAGRSKESPKIKSRTETPDFEGRGAKRQGRGSGPKVSDSSPHCGGAVYPEPSGKGRSRTMPDLIRIAALGRPSPSDLPQ